MNGCGLASNDDNEESSNTINEEDAQEVEGFVTQFYDNLAMRDDEHLDQMMLDDFIGVEYDALVYDDLTHMEVWSMEKS